MPMIRWRTTNRIRLAIAGFACLLPLLVLLRLPSEIDTVPPAKQPPPSRIAAFDTAKLQQQQQQQPGIDSRHEQLLIDDTTDPSSEDTIAYITPENGEELDARWMRALHSARIEYITKIPYGLSVKYVVHLEGGFKAAMKPALDPLEVANKTVRTIVSLDSVPYRYVTRTGRMNQGTAEIPAFYLDRTLRLYRKPPTIGRLVSNKVFYFWDDSPDGRLHYEMDEYYLPVAMLGWISGMRMYYPTLYAPHMEPTLKLCLLSTKLAHANNTNNKKHVELNLIANVCLRSEDGQSLLMNTSLPIGVGRVRRLRQITEAIMFDFLIDDHDRKRTYGNWMFDQAGTLLLWDSGIAWEHGPTGRPDGNCGRILCGPEVFHPPIPSNLTDLEKRKVEAKCKRICRFSRPFTKLLREHATGDLGLLWRTKMIHDPLFPVFEQHANFYPYRNRTKEAIVRLSENEFRTGLNQQVTKLLQHIDGCIKKYGEDSVLF